jgi:hypothetical protein
MDCRWRVLAKCRKVAKITASVRARQDLHRNEKVASEKLCVKGTPGRSSPQRTRRNPPDCLRSLPTRCRSRLDRFPQILRHHRIRIDARSRTEWGLGYG